MSRRILACIAALLGMLALAGCTGKDAVDQSAGSQFRFVSATKVGHLIPEQSRKHVGEVTGSLLAGGTFNLAADAGQVVVVNFWATWCGPCKTETPQFDSVYRQMHSQGVDFVGMDVKEFERSAATAFVTDNHISYPIVWDEEGKTALELGHVPAEALPFTVLIDKQQRVAAVYQVPLAPADLQPVLDSLVAES
jgi:thiol-disulfide isomerase/thioredoxin